MILILISVFWLAAAILLYVQVGYLALLWLVSKFIRRVDRHQPESCRLQSVTLIIPAYNEESIIRAKIENAMGIDYPRDRLEIIVAIDGSSDRTTEIARSFECRGVRVLAFPQRRGKAAVLNDVVSEASGEVLCLCDANVMFRPDALGKLLCWLDDPKVGAVSGDVRLASNESNFGRGESFYYRLERMMQQAESRVGSMMGVDGGMYVVRRELFQPLPDDTILDDFVTTMRVIQQGQRVVYEPTAVATENGTPLARQEFRRRVRVTAGAVQSLKRRQWPPLRQPLVLWQYMSHKVLRWMGPIWLAALLVSSLMLCGEIVICRVASVVQVVVLLLAIAAGMSLRFRRTWIGGVVFYFVISHLAIAVGLTKGLMNRQPATWRRTERTTTCNDVNTTAAGQ